MNSRLTKLLLVLACSALVPGACSNSQIGSRLSGEKKHKKKTKVEESSPSESVARLKALNDEDALAFLKDNCASCHAKGKDLHSTWPMPEEDQLSIETLEGMDTIAAAYQSVVNRFIKAPSSHRPSPMPTVALEGEDRDKLEGLIYWFQISMPSVVKEAEQVYGSSGQLTSMLDVNLSYQCSKRTSGKNYIFRMFNQALGRTPTADELDKYLPAKERDAAITDSRRASLAALVTDGDLKPDFFNYGLKIFAQRVGGAGSIKASPTFGISEDAATDLQQEFYQRLLADVEQLSYKDILLSNKVKVTSNTHAFYADGDAPCVDPGAGAWGDCTLSQRRGNFFGSVGFLKSTPSSFLASNNNYKRGGEIHAIVRGERLMAQTDGPPGQKPGVIPECIATKDVRFVVDDPAKPDGPKAPRGAMAVPREGAICYGCHLQKHLGLASYVFRPFDENGLVIPDTAFNVADPKNPYADLVKMATQPNIQNLDLSSGALAPVTVDTLKGFLAENSASQEQCIANRNGAKSLKKVQTIADLSDYIIGDGSVLVHGLARFIPSALSNTALTNQEVIAALSGASQKGNGMLLPIFKAYFESETFSCAVENK